MAEEQKPVAATEAPIVEPTPAVVVGEEVKAVEPAAETKVGEPAKEVEAVAAPAEEKKEEKPIEPIYSGSLGYKAPGLKNAFRFSKKYFWFAEEAIETKNLSDYLRGEKPDVAYPTAAWSSQTGKGLVYFVKHADKKETPAGVLKLAGATDLVKDGTIAFHFKLHGHKHTFEASTSTERDGWFVAFQQAIEEAAAKEKEIVESEGYKEQLEKLKKPVPVTVASSSAPKKSTDATTAAAAVAAKPEGEAVAEEPAPARAGSSSSSSSDEDKKKKSKSKSRSVSRGKRTSFFGGIMGKKEKLEEKKEEKKEKLEEKKEEKKEKLEEKKEEKKEKLEEKKEEKKEEKAEAEEAKAEPAAPAAEASAIVAAAPVPALEEPAKPAEEAKAEEIPAAEPVTETKAEEKKPKPTKRGSIFGSLAQKWKSPTTEKKESEVVPAVPAKDTEAVAEAPKTEEAVVALPEAPVTATEAPKVEETKPAATTPHKEKENLFGKFFSKAKSPVTETAPKVEEAPKVETAAEAPVVAPVVAPEAPKEEEKKEEAPLGVTATAAAAPAPKSKRGSIFGNFGGSVKKDKEVKEGEASEAKSKLSGLFRNASKSVKPKKEKEPAAPAKVEEATETKEAPKEEAPKEETLVEPKPAAAEPAMIGDVVPEAVTVGQAPKSNPEVSATA